MSADLSLSDDAGEEPNETTMLPDDHGQHVTVEPSRPGWARNGFESRADAVENLTMSVLMEIVPETKQGIRLPATGRNLALDACGVGPPDQTELGIQDGLRCVPGVASAQTIENLVDDGPLALVLGPRRAVGRLGRTHARTNMHI